MTDIIELAKKCGALELRIGLVLTKEQLQAFEAAIRQDQIEKDAKICDDNHAHDQAYDIRRQLTKQEQRDAQEE